MTKKARQTLNAIEDNEQAAPQPKRTFEQAVAYAVERGYKWLLWGGRYYIINNGRAIAA